MKTQPFFGLPPDSAPLGSAAAKPGRYPYHDDSSCPVGQEVQRSGRWQYYEPTAVSQTRVRCTICLALSRRANY